MEDGSYKTITDPKEIEEQLINQNLNHYTQAEKTAMANYLIHTKIGTSGILEFCNSILQGTADLSNLPITLQAIFLQLHQQHSVEENDLINFDDYKDVLPIWKEKSTIWIWQRIKWFSHIMDNNQHHLILDFGSTDGIGATHSCPQEQLTTNHTTEAFVDNSTNFINGSSEAKPFTETQLGHWLCLQNKAWERILSVSGGKLELPKCLAYIIVYNWNKGKPQQ
jgi:hypothetical protein